MHTYKYDSNPPKTFLFFAILNTRVLACSPRLKQPTCHVRPCEFLPERHINPSPAPHRFANVPFGGGRRICPGHVLAPFEIRTVIAYLVRRFSFAEGASEPCIKAHGMVQQCLDNFIVLTPLEMDDK